MAPIKINKGREVIRLSETSRGWLSLALKRKGRAGSWAIERGLYA